MSDPTHIRKRVKRTSDSHVLTDLVHVQRQERVLLARDDDDRVGPADGGCYERNETEKRELIGTGDADDAHRFVQLDHRAVQLGFLEEKL